MSTETTTLRTPCLRFPEFSDNWEDKRLEDVAGIIGGGYGRKIFTFSLKQGV